MSIAKVTGGRLRSYKVGKVIRGNMRLHEIKSCHMMLHEVTLVKMRSAKAGGGGSHMMFAEVAWGSHEMTEGHKRLVS